MLYWVRRRSFRMVLLLVLGGLMASARAHGLGPKADVFLGYSRLGNNVFSSGAGSLNGWEGALNVKVKDFVGMEGDVAQYGIGAAPTAPHTTVAMFGPRVTVGGLGVHLFVHALAGVDHNSNSTGLSQTDLAIGLGGGGDLRIAPFFALRVSADYLATPTFSHADDQHERATAGLVFRF